MRHEWAGDCDLGDGKLQTLYQEYMDRKTFYGSRVRMKEDMALVISGLDNDLRFLVGGEKLQKTSMQLNNVSQMLLKMACLHWLGSVNASRLSLTLTKT
ncbi:unnamed protein product [Porites lobata]|uniref:Uncharacterized protein n=1 Tax=Porites lobata TaxID=104759 RepID=A0ABN8S3L1_9CNID|nr:unnamed protein product [Porites lobata]